MSWTQANDRGDIPATSIPVSATPEFISCRVVRTTNFSMSNTQQFSPIEIPLTTVEWDLIGANPGNQWNGTNIVIQQFNASGRIMVIGFVEYAANSTNDRGCFMFINDISGAYRYIHRPSCSGTQTTTLHFKEEFRISQTVVPEVGGATNRTLAIGDYIGLCGFQNSTGSLNVSRASLTMLALP